MTRLLCATDGSRGAERALALAIRICRATPTELHVVNVIGGYGLPGGLFRGVTRAQTNWFEEALVANASEILGKARAQVEAAELPAPILHTERGDVAEALLRYVESRSIEAVVVGKRGSGQWEGALLGSVSQKLVSLSPVVVVVVP
ncbi:MAG: universal stress protein [Paracoccaceae bacterium]|nr:universal stress protein [Paracoccaceae bacterium]MDE3123225.1 universal stress protein [Paracoccaceae bacterium]